MGLFKGLLDFALFKEFVTPAFLKFLYLVLFVIMNITGLIGIGFFFISLMAAAGVSSQDFLTLFINLFIALVISASLLLSLIVSNLLLRMYFEIVLLMFNIHGYLKSMERKMGKGR